MSADLYIAFVISSFLLAAVPGPDNMFVLAQSALFGAKAGLLVVCGLCLGLLVQTVCAALGLAALVAALPPLFWTIKIAGALYLLYLAYLAVRHARDLSDKPQVSALTKGSLVRRGFIMNITNPKVQIFFLAFFPQFVLPGTVGGQLAFYMIVLGLTFMVATLLVFAAVALAAGYLSARLQGQRFTTVLNYTSALLFTVLALLTLAT